MTLVRGNAYWVNEWMANGQRLWGQAPYRTVAFWTERQEAWIDLTVTLGEK